MTCGSLNGPNDITITVQDLLTRLHCFWKMTKVEHCQIDWVFKMEGQMNRLQGSKPT